MFGHGGIRCYLTPICASLSRRRPPSVFPPSYHVSSCTLRASLQTILRVGVCTGCLISNFGILHPFVIVPWRKIFFLNESRTRMNIRREYIVSLNFHPNKYCTKKLFKWNLLSTRDKVCNIQIEISPKLIIYYTDLLFI